MAGVGKAFTYSLAGRGISVVAGLALPEVLSRAVGSIDQGVYFGILGLLAVQVVYELGLSNLLVTRVSHAREENADDSRLGKLLRGSLLWYGGVVALVTSGSLLAGPWFLPEDSNWWPPLATACVCAALQTMTMPLVAFLEGMGEIAEVARARMLQTVGASLGTIGGLLGGAGLHAIAWMNVGLFLGALPLLWKFRHQLTAAVSDRRPCSAFVWRRDMFPLQFRSLFVWLGVFVVNGLATLVVMRFAGAEAAGRWGLTRRVFEVLLLVSGSLLTLRAPVFGAAYAAGRTSELLREWRRWFIAAVGLCLLLVAVACGAFEILGQLGLAFPDRLVGSDVRLWLAAVTVLACAVWGLEILARSSFSEPFAMSAAARAAVTVALLYALVPATGVSGAAWALLGGLLLAGLPMTLWLCRREVAKWPKPMGDRPKTEGLKV